MPASNASRALRYDFQGVMLPEHGLAPGDLEAIADKLDAARREVVTTDQEQVRGDASKVPPAKQPLDARFYDMPRRLLDEYARDETGSELGRILARAEALRAEVDKVVILGIGGSYMGARALFDALLDRYHNELSREARKDVPRIYFEGNNVDNDTAASLLSLLNGEGSSPTHFHEVLNRWGLIVISKSGGTLEAAAAFRVFLARLIQRCGGDVAAAAKLIVPITGDSGKLHDLAKSLGIDDLYSVPDGVGGRFSILSAVGLLPAAVMGIDVVELLRGAADMTERFETAAVGDNPVLDYVGVCHLLETKQQIDLRVLSVWSSTLEAVGLWYDQLLAESLGKDEKGATPLTVVNTRDLHSRAQQHQEGKRDRVMTNLIVDSWRHDPVKVGKTGYNQDKLDDLADRSYAELMSAAIAGTNEAYKADNRPTADIVLPEVSAYTLGQLFQMFMIATVVEGRLIGINPYGQPGVEAYKKAMNKHLGR